MKDLYTRKLPALRGKLTAKINLRGRLYKGRYDERSIATKSDILSIFHFKEEKE